MLLGLRNSLWPTGDSLVPKRVRTTWLASRHPHAFLIHVSELFTTRSSSRPIRFTRIVTPTGREKTVHAVRCPCTSRKCRFSRQMKVISVVSDIWSQSFYSTEASFQFNSKIYQSEKIPKWTRSWFPVSWNSKVAPLFEFPIPAERSTLLAIVVEWKLVFVWFVTWNYASDCIVQVHVSSTVHKWRIW